MCLALREPAKIQEQREKPTDNYSVYKRVLHLAQFSLRAETVQMRLMVGTIRVVPIYLTFPLCQAHQYKPSQPYYLV